MTGSKPRSERFTRACRLAHRREFAAVYAGKARVERGPLAVHAIPTDRACSRIGLAIGRRVGTAVRRVRLKRMLREAFRTARASLPGTYDLVVSARSHDDLGLGGYRSLLLDAVTELDRIWRKRRERTERRRPAPEGDPPSRHGG